MKIKKEEQFLLKQMVKIIKNKFLQMILFHIKKKLNKILVKEVIVQIENKLILQNKIHQDKLKKELVKLRKKLMKMKNVNIQMKILIKILNKIIILIKNLMKIHFIKEL